MADGEPIDIQPLSATAATDVRLAGGKGATLARLLQAGFPVPIGCVFSPAAFSVYLVAQGLSADSTPDKMQQALRSGTPPPALTVALEHVLANLGPAPHGWAVRSSAIAEDSATASFAGIYESVLAVQPSELWSAIRHCWLSWWSEHAMAYRQQVSATPAAPALAVVLQHMVAARSAGVAFTAEPIHHDRTRMVINAAAGLGVAVVSGVVEPEQYTLAKGPPITLLERRLPHHGQPPLLSAARLDILGALLQRLENFCGSPQDVEWAWDGSTVWILQSRPITTWRGESEQEDTDVWGNANLKDVMPGLVSPFTWSLMQPQLETAMREQWRRAGYTVPLTRPLMRRFWGRPYFNLTVFQEVASTLYGTTPSQQATQLGGAVIPHAMPAQPPSLWQRLRWLGNMLRFAGMADKARKAAPAQFARVEQVWRQTLQSVSQLDRASLLAAIERHATLGETFLLLHLHLTWAMSGNFSALQDLVKRSIPQAYAGLFADLVTGLGDVQSAEHSYRLWDLSRLARQSPQVITFLSRKAWANWQQSLAGTDFLQAWETFLNTYGHRALYEVEIANPRWREQPDYLFDILAAYVHLSQEQTPFHPTAQARRRQDAEHTASRHLGPFKRFWFRHILQRAQAFSRWRENSKSHLVMLIDMTRQFTLAAARFLIADGLIDEPAEVFFLEKDEVKAALQGPAERQDIQRLITQRRLARQRQAARHAPDLFLGDRPVYNTAPTPPGPTLTGLPSNPGLVTGIARVLRTPHEGARLQPGEILVVPSTDPGWTPLFLLASGLVMETGGYLSHGAIVAREYGIPAVINVPLATQRIGDGSTITIDGGQGIVWLTPSGQ